MACKKQAPGASGVKDFKMKPSHVERIYILDTPVDVIDFRGALEAAAGCVESESKTVIFTPNVRHVSMACLDPEFRAVYKQADLSLVDGMPLVWVSALFGGKLPERINGTNLVSELCAVLAQKRKSVFLLAMREEVAAMSGRELKDKYPGLDVSGYGFLAKGEVFDDSKARKVIEKINALRPDVLIVGLGAPLQEKWILKYRHLIDSRVFLAVGSALDFISLRIKRSPKWMQDRGLEWLHRINQEPLRLGMRYIVDGMVFLFFLSRYMFRKSRAK